MCDWIQCQQQRRMHSVLVPMSDMPAIAWTEKLRNLHATTFLFLSCKWKLYQKHYPRLCRSKHSQLFTLPSMCLRILFVLALRQFKMLLELPNKLCSVLLICTMFSLRKWFLLKFKQFMLTVPDQRMSKLFSGWKYLHELHQRILLDVK